MNVPTIGRIVTYRHPRGYDVPAIVVATVESLAAANGRLRKDATKFPLEDREIRPLSGPCHAHLTIFTATTTAEHGTGRARDVPCAGEMPNVTDFEDARDDVDEWPAANTWRWPELQP